MISDRLLLSSLFPHVVTTIRFLFHECDLPNQDIYQVCKTWATRRVPHAEHYLFIFQSTWYHPQFLVGFVLINLQFSMLYLAYFYLFCLFVFFFFNHGVVSLFSTESMSLTVPLVSFSPLTMFLQLFLSIFTKIVYEWYYITNYCSKLYIL